MPAQSWSASPRASQHSGYAPQHLQVDPQRLEAHTDASSHRSTTRWQAELRMSVAACSVL